MEWKPIRIEIKDKSAHVFIDGKDVSQNCVGYKVEQKAGGFAKLTIKTVYYTKDLEIGGEAIVKQNCVGRDAQ